MTFGGQGRLSPPQPTVALRRSASPARSPSSHGRSPTDESQQVDAFDDGAEDSDEDLFGEGRGEDAGPRSAAAGTAATANSEAAATSAGVGDGDEAVELERPYAECTLTVSIGKTTIGKDSAIGLWTHHKAPDLEKLGVKRMRELLIEKAEGVVSAADKGRISSDEPPVVYYYDRAKGGRNGGNPTNVSTPNILQTPTQLQALLKAARPSKRKRADAYDNGQIGFAVSFVRGTARATQAQTPAGAAAAAAAAAADEDARGDGVVVRPTLKHPIYFDPIKNVPVTVDPQCEKMQPSSAIVRKSTHTIALDGTMGGEMGRLQNFVEELVSELPQAQASYYNTAGSVYICQGSRNPENNLEVVSSDVLVYSQLVGTRRPSRYTDEPKEIFVSFPAAHNAPGAMPQPTTTARYTPLKTGSDSQSAEAHDEANLPPQLQSVEGRRVLASARQASAAQENSYMSFLHLCITDRGCKIYLDEAHMKAIVKVMAQNGARAEEKTIPPLVNGATWIGSGLESLPWEEKEYSSPSEKRVHDLLIIALVPSPRHTMSIMIRTLE